MAQRSAQTAALALLREVIRRSSSSSSQNRQRDPPVQGSPSSGVEDAPSSPDGHGAPTNSPAADSGRPGSASNGNAAASAAVATASGGASKNPEAGSVVGDVSVSGGGAGAGTASEWSAVRRALLQRTPLLAGLVRCLVGGSANATAAAAGPARRRRGGSDGGREAGAAAVRVFGEACGTLRCLLSSEVGGCVLRESGGELSEVPQAVLRALEGLGELWRGSSGQDGSWSGGGGGGCGEAVRICEQFFEMRDVVTMFGM